MEITPLGKNVIIEVDEREKEIGGIEIPEDRRRRSKTATVVKCGRDVVDLKDVDRIIIEPFAGNQLKCDGKNLWLMSEDDVIAVLV